MKYKKNPWKGFTLIEILVSITIFAIIMISVFGIFISSSNINLKTDITRTMQQNIKSSIERIAEDVRKNGFDCVRESYSDECVLPDDNNTNTWTILEIWSNQYYLAVKNGSDYISVDRESCTEISDTCTLVLNGKPIMNSWVSVKDLQFLISDTHVKKLTILITLQPATWKWIPADLIKNNNFYFQTTISERITLN